MEFKISCLLNINSAISTSEGDKLYDLIYPYIKENFDSDKSEDIIIDFSDIDDLTTAFLNNSIAKLFYNIDSEYLLKVLKFKNFTSNIHIKLLKLSLSNAIAMKDKK